MTNLTEMDSNICELFWQWLLAEKCLFNQILIIFCQLNSSNALCTGNSWKIRNLECFDFCALLTKCIWAFPNFSELTALESFTYLNGSDLFLMWLWGVTGAGRSMLKMIHAHGCWQGPVCSVHLFTELLRSSWHGSWLPTEWGIQKIREWQAESHSMFHDLALKSYGHFHYDSMGWKWITRIKLTF